MKKYNVKYQVVAEVRYVEEAISWKVMIIFSMLS